MVMRKVVQFNDWLDEEVDNMAREGLRTLVMSKKTLSSEHYLDFEQKYKAAKLSLVNRSAQGIFIYWIFFFKQSRFLEVIQIMVQTYTHYRNIL